MPALNLKIASATRCTSQEKDLENGMVPVAIEVENSFNERLLQIQVLGLTGGQELFAYGLVNLNAEKYRAILQQVPRRRNRRQDVYDLDRLVARKEVDEELKAEILAALNAKSVGVNNTPIRHHFVATEFVCFPLNK